MSYKNTVTINISQMGKTKGSCLANTRIAAVPDIPAKYPDATTARHNTILHAGTPPSNVWVPVFFTFYATVDGVYKDWGHIGWYKDGKFWSDGVEYSSIASYESNHAPRYVGWGETLNGVRVVEYVAAPAPTPTGKTLHLDKGTITTTYSAAGSKVGSIYARDDTYNYVIRENDGNRVKINSASGGGDGIYVYLRYSATGALIPGREIK